MRRTIALLLAIALGASAIATAAAPRPAAADDPGILRLAASPSGPINDAVYDEASGLVLASVPGHAGSDRNRVIAFDPADGSVAWNVFVGDEPNVLALSEDGSKLYVGLLSENSVKRVDMATRQVDLEFSLGADGTQKLYAEEIEFLPGSSSSVVIARQRLSGSPRHEGLVVFDEDVARPVTTPDHTGPNTIEMVDSELGYGYETGSSGFRIYTLELDADGIAVVETQSTAIAGFGNGLTLVDGILYGAGGGIVDPANWDALATLPVDGIGDPIVADGKVYVIEANPGSVYEFDAGTYAATRYPLPISQLSTQRNSNALLTPHGFVIWDRNGFAELRDATPGLPRLFHDAIYDENRSLVYAVTSGLSSLHPNSLVALDPESLEVRWSTWVGSEPGLLDLSYDGRKIYIGMRGPSTVVTVDLASRTVESEFQLGRDDWSGPLWAEEIEALPGAAGSVVVRDHSLLRVFDNGIARPNSASGSHFTPWVMEAVSATVVRGASDSAVYELVLDANGIASSTETRVDEMRGWPTVIGGVAYDTYGTATDLETGRVLWTVDSGASSPFGPVIDDTTVHVVDTHPHNRIYTFDRDDGSVGRQKRLLAPVGEPQGGLATPFGLMLWTDLAFGYAEGPGWIDGTLIDAVTGEPVNQHCVTAVGEDADYDTETDGLGRYSFELPVGEYFLVFYGCDFLTYFVEWHGGAPLYDFDAARPIQVRDSKTEALSARLAPIFSDLDPRSTFALDIVWIRHGGITTGCSAELFCPRDPVTREQMASFIARFWRLIEADCGDLAHPFIDVRGSSFASDDIGCIFDLEITTGTSPSTYSPARRVTRIEMAAFLARLWRALGLPCPAGEHPFVDVPANSFATNDVACIFLLGVTTGTSSTTYDPDAIVTREQMAAFLARLGRLVFT